MITICCQQDHSDPISHQLRRTYTQGGGPGGPQGGGPGTQSGLKWLRIGGLPGMNIGRRPLLLLLTGIGLAPITRGEDSVSGALAMPAIGSLSNTSR